VIVPFALVRFRGGPLRAVRRRGGLLTHEGDLPAWAAEVGFRIAHHRIDDPDDDAVAEWRSEGCHFREGESA